MKTIKRGIYLLLIISILFVSCGKTGPAGPQGPAGQNGASGPQGPAGTANVLYSSWFTPSAYTVTTRFGVIHLDFNEPAPGITQAILDNGTVLTYGKLNGYDPGIWPTNQTALLPVTVMFLNGSITDIDTWSALLSPGNLEIDLVSSTNIYRSDADINHTHSFRYIIVPGGTPVARQSPPPDFNNYGAVCKYYGIPE